MAEVLSEIERIKRQEQAREWDKNEKAMLEKLAPLPRVDLAPHKEHIESFMAWCAKSGVRHCVAKPWVVATYLNEHGHRGEAFLVDAISAISALHDYHRQPNPAATQQLRAELDKIIKPDVPRSWSKAEKAMFSLLPSDVRAAINRRERHREAEGSQLRNEIAELRKRSNENKTEAAPVRYGNGGEPVQGAERPREPSGASAG